MKTNGHSELNGNGAGPMAQHVSVGPVMVDRAARRVYSSNTDVQLSPLEYRLLDVMLDRCGESLSRRQLLKDVWDTEAEIETRTVDMHIARLRSKLGPAGSMIETVRGMGYRFHCESEPNGATSRVTPRAARPASTFPARDRLDQRTG